MKVAAAHKIVFVNRYFYPDLSATSQLLTDVASALAEAGLDVHVVCSRQRHDDSSARLAPRDTANGVVVHRVWTSRFGRNNLLGRGVDYITFYMSCGLALMGLLRRGDKVIAKTDPPLISIIAMWAAKWKGASLINWLQDIFPEVASNLGANPLPLVLDLLVRRCRDWSLRCACSNVVLGERMRERLALMGIPADKLEIVENWAQLDPEEPRMTRSSLLRWSLRLDGEFVVGYSGILAGP